MELILFMGFIFCFLFMIITQVVFWRNRKLARKEIITDWTKFLNAEKANNINSMKLYGEKLIWNRYISQDQIDKLNESLSLRLKKNPKLESLYEVTKDRRSYLSDDERKQIYGK